MADPLACPKAAKKADMRVEQWAAPRAAKLVAPKAVQSVRTSVGQMAG